MKSDEKRNTVAEMSEKDRSVETLLLPAVKEPTIQGV
jgi:hypothetical protein